MKYLNTTVMLMTLILTIGISTTTLASTNLVVPVYTTHIIERGNYQYNESNPGLGLEYRAHNYYVGYMHAFNSFSKQANYLYVAKPVAYGTSIGLLAMTNQAIKFTADSEPLKYKTVVTPILSYQYKYFRISTSYPFAKTFAPTEYSEVADLVNVQLVYKF